MDDVRYNANGDITAARTQRIMMSVITFKRFCMLAKTGKRPIQCESTTLTMEEPEVLTE
jgi:hypothetical protein